MAKGQKRVLVCDLDPQGNSTSGLGVDKQSLDATLYDVLFGRAEASSVIREVSSHGIYLLPANADLASAELEMVNSPKREFLLKNVLDKLEYD